jgi:acetate kinase
VNTGSSSLKVALYELGFSERLAFGADADRIGRADARLRVRGEAQPDVAPAALADHGAALALVLERLEREGPAPDAVGHRLVHGGPDLVEPVRLSPEARRLLERVVPLAPDHLPQALAAIDVVDRALPGVTQVACFDTAFHRTMPRVAQIVPLPRDVTGSTIVRYGFHGLSYEYVVGALAAEDPEAAAGRLIVAHLGNGASMAAVSSSRSLDTTMGFTPAGGLVMSTRSGDLDPGVLVHLAERRGLDGATLNELVNRRSGLLGVSGLSADMEELLASRDPAAAEAVELFCYQARKAIGALSAVLGGLDTLVFTAGIGERAPTVRAAICAGLGYLGIELDEEANERGDRIVSAAGSTVTVRVLATNEDLVIARHTRDLLARHGRDGGSA